MVILNIWAWSITMTVAYSDTITTSLALSFSLFIGDFGIENYVTQGYKFDWYSFFGLVLVLIAFCWLIKRLIAVNCAETCSEWCSWGNEGIHDGNEYDGMFEAETLVELPEANRYSYGSTTTSTPYDQGQEPPKKKKKKKKNQGVEEV